MPRQLFPLRANRPAEQQRERFTHPELRLWRWVLFAAMARLDSPEDAAGVPVTRTIICSRAVKIP